MKSEKWHQAADYVFKYIQFDVDTIESLFTDSIITLESGTLTVSDACRKMEEHRKWLINLCLTKMQSDDVDAGNSSWTEYWQMLPKLGATLIAMEKLDEVIRKALRNAVKIPNELIDGKSINFATALTKVFEAIANTIDKQAPTVKNIFGPGRMLFLIRSLEMEADLQCVKLLDLFQEQKSLQAKLQIRDAQFQRLENDTKKSGDDSEMNLDLKELSKLLDELSLICQRVSQFVRFLKVRSSDELKEIEAIHESSADKKAKPVEDELLNELILYYTTQKSNNDFISYSKNSELQRRVKELVSLYYIPFEELFIMQSAQKALISDSFDSDSEDLTSSSVEDCFFLYKRVTSRAINTYNVSAICTVLNFVARSLELQYFNNGLKKKLSTSFGGDKAVNLSERPESRIAYAILLNNSFSSAGFVDQFCRSINEDVNAAWKNIDDDLQAKEKIQACLSPIISLDRNFMDLARFGAQIMFNQLIKNKVKVLYGELFSGMKLTLTESEFNESEKVGSYVILVSDSALGSVTGNSYRDSLLRRFKEQFYRTIDERVRLYLLPEVFGIVLQICFSNLISKYEYVLFSSPGINLFGAFRMDKDLRNIIAYFNSLTEDQQTLNFFRSHSSKLLKLLSLVSLDDVDELKETLVDTKEWLSHSKITRDELMKVVSSRFGSDAMNRIERAPMDDV